MRGFLSRHKLLLGVELLCIMLCALFCFRPNKEVFSVDADGIAEKMNADGYSDYYCSAPFVLQPGVYQLRLQGGDHEGILYPTVSASESSFQALRCNGVTVVAHQREVEIEVYVVDRVESAYVSCNYIGETGQPVDRIVLHRTSMGWRMLLFIVLLVVTGLNLLIWLREGIIKDVISREQAVVAGALGLCILLAYLPYATDYMNLGSDGAFHLLRIEGLKETLLHGQQFPVRIQEYWLYGHGYAVSSFCGDLFLLFPAMLRLIGFSIMDAYKLFVLAVLAGTAVIAYRSFYRCTGSRYGALLGSALYELAPYHIYTVYNRNAMGEYLGMMFLPLVVYGFYRIYTEDVGRKEYTKAKIPLVVGLGCILQSHVSTWEMTVIALAAAAAVMWRRTFRRETLWELIKAAVYCLLLNAWFWVPLLKMLSVDNYALGERMGQNIQHMGTSLAGILQMYPYMGGGQTGMYNGEPIQAGAALWAVLLLYIVILLCRRARGGENSTPNPYDRVMRWGALVSLLFLLLSTRYFPWDILARIPGGGLLVQSPARFLAFTALSGAFTAAFFLLWLREESTRWNSEYRGVVTLGSVLLITVIALCSALYHVNDISYVTEPVRLYTAESLGSVDVAGGEYLLRGMDVQEIQCHDPVADQGLLWQDYSKEGLRVKLHVENPTAEELYVELPLTGYRGYGVDGDEGDRIPYITEERGAHGDLRIAVPAGYAGNITVSYKGFAIFRIAEGISVLTALLCLGMGLNKRFVKGKESSHE